MTVVSFRKSTNRLIAGGFLSAGLIFKTSDGFGQDLYRGSGKNLNMIIAQVTTRSPGTTTTDVTTVAGWTALMANPTRVNQRFADASRENLLGDFLSLSNLIANNSNDPNVASLHRARALLITRLGSGLTSQRITDRSQIGDPAEVSRFANIVIAIRTSINSMDSSAQYYADCSASLNYLVGLSSLVGIVPAGNPNPGERAQTSEPTTLLIRQPEDLAALAQFTASHPFQATFATPLSNDLITSLVGGPGATVLGISAPAWSIQLQTDLLNLSRAIADPTQDAAAAGLALAHTLAPLETNTGIPSNQRSIIRNADNYFRQGTRAGLQAGLALLAPLNALTGVWENLPRLAVFNWDGSTMRTSTWRASVSLCSETNMVEQLQAYRETNPSGPNAHRLTGLDLLCYSAAVSLSALQTIARYSEQDPRTGAQIGPSRPITSTGQDITIDFAHLRLGGYSWIPRWLGEAEGGIMNLDLTMGAILQTASASTTSSGGVSGAIPQALSSSADSTIFYGDIQLTSLGRSTGTSNIRVTGVGMRFDYPLGSGQLYSTMRTTVSGHWFDTNLGGTRITARTDLTGGLRLALSPDNQYFADRPIGEFNLVPLNVNARFGGRIARHFTASLGPGLHVFVGRSGGPEQPVLSTEYYVQGQVGWNPGERGVPVVSVAGRASGISRSDDGSALNPFAMQTFGYGVTVNLDVLELYNRIAGAASSAPRSRTSGSGSQTPR